MSQSPLVYYGGAAPVVTLNVLLAVVVVAVVVIVIVCPTFMRQQVAMMGVVAVSVIYVLDYLNVFKLNSFTKAYEGVESGLKSAMGMSY